MVACIQLHAHFTIICNQTSQLYTKFRMLFPAMMIITDEFFYQYNCTHITVAPKMINFLFIHLYIRILNNPFTHSINLLTRNQTFSKKCPCLYNEFYKSQNNKRQYANHEEIFFTLFKS